MSRPETGTAFRSPAFAGVQLPCTPCAKPEIANGLGAAGPCPWPGWPRGRAGPAGKLTAGGQQPRDFGQSTKATAGSRDLRTTVRLRRASSGSRSGGGRAADGPGSGWLTVEEEVEDEISHVAQACRCLGADQLCQQPLPSSKTLRRSLEREDRQVSLTIEVCDDPFKAHTRIATGPCLWQGATGVAWPPQPGFPSWPLVGGGDASIGFVGCLAAQGAVRLSVTVAPASTGGRSCRRPRWK